MINSTSGTLNGAGGVALHWTAVHPDHPRAAVTIVHGLGEHGGRYDLVAGALAGRGFAVTTYDLRGHGRSGGGRGHATLVELMDDLHRVRTLGARAHPEVPLFILGHSLGGLVLLRYLADHAAGLTGAIASAPWLATAGSVSALRREVARFLLRYAPALGIPQSIRPELLTRDPAMQRARREDRFVHSRISARLFADVEKAQSEVLSSSASLGVPLLVLVPEGDELVDPVRTLAYAREARGPVDIELLPGLRHEPFNEPEREEVFRTVAEWMEGQLQAAS